MTTHMDRAWRGLVLGAVLASLAACGPPPPLRIGFLGGLSDRDAHFSEDARNGVILGIERFNAAGGVAGRRVELVVQDYGQGLERAVPAVQALLDAKVDVVIGPYSSPVAAQVLPVVDRARVLLLGPTVTGNTLTGRDDHLVRLNIGNQASAHDTARMLHAAGWRRPVLARDMRNTDYAVGWSQAFAAAFAELGGAIVGQVDFGQGPAASFDLIVREMLALQPDGLLFVAGAVDAARLAQQVDKLAPKTPLAAAGWAGNPSLIELGGKAVEGMRLTQTYNRADPSPRYRSFHDAYLERFGGEPSYSAIASFDALLVLAEAVGRAQAGEPLRDAVLRHGPYQGLQQTIAFDRFGDAERPVYFTVVRGGQFVLAP